MNLVLIRDGIKLKMLIELDPANDPADEASDLQEIAERFGFDTYDLEDAAPLAQQDTHATHVVRTKNPCHPWQDLTDDEINEIRWCEPLDFARAVIAADRKLNGVEK